MFSSSSPPLRRILAVRAHSTTRRYAPLYVAATRQHVGKTTTSLALMAGLLQRFSNQVGFLKPVGQQSVRVVTDTGQTLVVDKDAALVKQYFGLAHVPYESMSPVLIPPGYTRDFLDGVITAAEQRARIEAAYTQMAQTCEGGMVLCEGTGHVAVGSIGTSSLSLIWIIWIERCVNTHTSSSFILSFNYSRRLQRRHCLLAGRQNDSRRQRRPRPFL